MAELCNLCGKQIGFFGKKIGYFGLCTITPKKINVCENCQHIFTNLIEYANKNENIDDRLEEFRNRYPEGKQTEYCIEYAREINTSAYNNIIEKQQQMKQLEEQNINKYAHIGPFTDKPYVYSIDGVRGRHIDIYNDKVVITTNVTLGSILAHNATDGEKTIYFSDCIGVQYKKSSFTIGYLQFETASSGGNNAASNFFHENSFTFDLSVVSNEKMEEVVAFVKGRIDEVKRAANAPVQTVTVAAPVAPNFIADELLKLKQLVDMGVLTQEEFDQQKKKILGQ